MGWLPIKAFLEFLYFFFALVFQRSNRVKRFKTQRNLKYNKNSLHYKIFYFFHTSNPQPIYRYLNFVALRKLVVLYFVISMKAHKIFLLHPVQLMNI